MPRRLPVVYQAPSQTREAPCVDVVAAPSLDRRSAYCTWRASCPSLPYSTVVQPLVAVGAPPLQLSDELRDRLGAAVLRVHHCGKDKGSRGRVGTRAFWPMTKSGVG